MAGFGILLTGYAGFHSLTGWPDRAPAPLVGAYTDYISPLLATSALIAALSHRRRTKEGQHIDISQVECGLQLLAPAILHYTANGRVWKRMGNRSLSACPHGVFRCKGEDKWCAIAVRDDEEWDCLKQALGNPPWASYGKFATFSKRKENEGMLENLLEEYTRERTDREVMDLLQSHGVPAGVVLDSKGLFEDPQLRYREFYKELDHPKAGRHYVLKEPFILSDTPSDLHRAAPCLGQDNEFVCKEIIGLSDEEFDQLLRDGVFG
jgi:benzylsuccinate CoA-transferase BbsF subunit